MIVHMLLRNVQWKDIDFRHCRVWDMAVPATQKAMTIAPGAYDIRIHGGL